VILLDTSVLSAAFRRRDPDRGHEAVFRLRRMISEDWPLSIPGVVRQELLSGVRTPEEWKRLQDVVEGFPVLLADLEDHFTAARVANACRQRGIASSTVDCLIAAQAIRSQASLFTLDQDFQHIAACCELQLLDRL
jgi:predicted nucleic acid-binding protein